MGSHNKNSLSTIVVSRAMRRQVNCLASTTTLSNSINTLIKHKVNGLLVVDEGRQPVGVVSKTDITGAYYADLPLDSPLEYIMSSPPIFCCPDDPLEKALEQMRDSSVYRLYVKDAEGAVAGSLAYPDIVGMLYQYCCDCEYSHFNKKEEGEPRGIQRGLVQDCMTREVKSVGEEETLLQVMEELSMFRMGAILVNDVHANPVGVISKTDLILAYKHQVDSQTVARSVMSVPVRTCKANDLLEDAIRTMIFTDVHRLFVKAPESESLIGVFSLTDAARNRSGSCHACISSRITLKAG
ncbi:MAG: CBS domain-containing protein [Desulforhopalus sp.]